MDKSSLERGPLQDIMILLGGAALYTVLLFQAVSAQSGWHAPAFLEDWLADPQTRFWAWDQCTHTFIVLLLSLPFAWVLTRFHPQRLLPAALVLVVPGCAWMLVDYLSLRDELPDALPVVNTFYAIDAVKVALTLPLLVLLLGKRRRS